jgi:hypothetical protein
MTRNSHTSSSFKKVEEASHDQFTSYILLSNDTTYQVNKTWAPRRYMNTRCRDDCLETDVHSANCGMNPTDRPEILPTTLVSDCLKYRVNFSTALVLVLQMWHIIGCSSFSAGRPAFVTATGVARHVSRKRCYGHQHVSASTTSTRIP